MVDFQFEIFFFLRFEIWNLFGFWCLEFGICLVLGTRDGAWNLEFYVGGCRRC